MTRRSSDGQSLRVTFISQWYAPEAGDGGVPRGIATALRDRGHDVEVLTGFPNYPEGRLYPGYRQRPYQREVIDGLPVHRAPLYVSHDTRGTRRAANYLSFAATSAVAGLTRVRTADVNLVYSSPITAACAALAQRRFRGTPYVLLIQDMWPQSVTESGMLSERRTRQIEPTLQRLCDHVYRRAAHIAVISPGMIDLVVDRGISRDKVDLVPNWADEAHYHPAPRNNQVRLELGLTRRFTVMYAGNMGEAQGLSAVLRAAELLRYRTDIGFAFVGRGAARDALLNRAKSLRLDNVVFAPPQSTERMAEVLAAADIQLVSLKDEPVFRSTTPSKLQSILAAGQPVLGFIAGDAARIIIESGAGVTAAPGSASDLASSVLTLAEMPRDELRRMGNVGLSYYQAAFSQAVVATQLDALLHANAHQRHRGFSGA